MSIIPRGNHLEPGCDRTCSEVSRHFKAELPTSLSSQVAATPTHMLRWLTTVPATLALLLVCLSGCGGSSAANTYHDSQYKFAIRLPKSWVVPKQGSDVANVGYVVHFTQPSGFRIVVGSAIVNLNKVPNGKVLHSPTGGCLATCTFYRVRVDGRPALFVKQVQGTTILEEDVDVNSTANGYQLQLDEPGLGGLPGVTPKQQTQFLQAARGLRLP